MTVKKSIQPLENTRREFCLKPIYLCDICSAPGVSRWKYNLEELTQQHLDWEEKITKAKAEGRYITFEDPIEKKERKADQKLIVKLNHQVFNQVKKK